MTATEQIKDKIRKLLNVAKNDAATDGEIENAMRAAQALMHAHRLEEHEIKEHNIDVRQEIRFARKHIWTRGAHMSMWENHLSVFVCRFLGTVQTYHQTGGTVRRTEAGVIMRNEDGTPKKGAKVTFYGPEEEVALALELFDELGITIVAMARLRYGSVFRGKGRSYAEGFVRGLNLKLEKTQEQLTSDAQSRALVVRSNELVASIKKDASDWLKNDQKIRLTTGQRRSNNNDWDAFQRGKKDGRSADVSVNRTKKLTS